MSRFSPPGLLLKLYTFIWFDTLDEPYKVEIADSNLVNTYGVGLVRAKINKTSQFTVDVQKAGAGHVTVNIAGMLYIDKCVLLGKSSTNRKLLEASTITSGTYRAGLPLASATFNFGSTYIFDLYIMWASHPL